VRKAPGFTLGLLLSLIALIWFMPQPALTQLRRTQVRMVHRELEIQLDDAVKVRSLKPPVQFDEKGKPRKLTADELKQLKSTDPKVPGYAREVGDLKPNQVVRVSLARQKHPKQDGKAADAKKPVDANDKGAWVSAGELSGVVVRYGPPRGGRPNNAEANKPEGAGESAKVLTIRLDLAAAGRPGRGAAFDDGGTGKLPKDTRATMVVIVQDVKAAPSKPRDKGQEEK
jgi:hypothetical protein